MDRRLPPYAIAVALLLLVAIIAVFALAIMPGLMTAGTTNSQTGATATMAVTETPGASGAYPKRGHAPDYSWVAGQVAFTRIQGGCVYIRIGAETGAKATPPPSGTITGPVVGTAVKSDTSP